jgi:hypothetical protein
LALRAACLALRAACLALRAACLALRAACLALRAACLALRAGEGGYHEDAGTRHLNTRGDGCRAALQRGHNPRLDD